MFVLLILLLVAQLCSKDFNLRSLYGRANSENKMSIFLFPLVKYTNVLLYACTSRTFRDIFLKRFACSESSVRMWMAVRSVLLCSCLLSLRQSCTEVATRPVFYVFFCLRVTRICYSINIPACGWAVVQQDGAYDFVTSSLITCALHSTLLGVPKRNFLSFLLSCVRVGYVPTVDCLVSQGVA